MASGFFGEIKNGEYTLRDWVKYFTDEKFNSFSRNILIEMGGFDWFGTDRSFYNKIIKDLAPKVVQLINSDKINADNTYVFFKENCPCVGPRYCDFRICDIESGDVLFSIGHLKNGCYGENFSGWDIWDYSVKNEGSFRTHNSTMKGTWNDVKKYFGI